MTPRELAPTLPDPDEEGTLETGAVLGGRYRLVRPLSSGGMGAIWLARHLDLESDIVIKAIEGRYRREPELLERFRREARAAAQLKTQHVVQIFDFGVDAGIPYIVMEHLQGEDLDELLEREGSLSPSRVLHVVRSMVKGLAAVHEAGIVHRDLKPGNIFLAQVGAEEMVKIIDFGIAKEFYRAADHATGGRTMGSPLFMSPEQIASTANVDARTDLWAVAAITYQMIVGEPPFSGKTLAELLHAVGQRPFEAPGARCAPLAPLDAFFARGLAKDRRQRFQSAGELLEHLERAIASLGDATIAQMGGRPRGASGPSRDAITAPDAARSRQAVTSAGQRSPSGRGTGDGGSIQPFAATTPGLTGGDGNAAPSWLLPRWHGMVPLTILIVAVLVLVATVGWKAVGGVNAPSEPSSAVPALPTARETPPVSSRASPHPVKRVHFDRPSDLARRAVALSNGQGQQSDDRTATDRAR